MIVTTAGARLGSLRALELRTIDRRLALPHPVPSLDELVIVGIEQSTFEGDLSTWGPAALDRAEYIPVIQHLLAWNARSIALDVFFAGEADPETDGKLARAIADARDVIVVAGAEATLGEGGEERRSFDLPPEPIASAARAVASPLLLRPDNVVRRVETMQRDPETDTAWPALSRAMLLEVGRDIPDRLMVNWAGPAGSVPTIPFEQVHAGTAEPSAVRGKHVLIGVTDEMKELFLTPVGPMSGVEIHAQAAATMLEGRYIAEAPATTGLLVAVPACLLVAMMGRARRYWWTWALAAGLAAAWFGVGALVFSRGLLLLPLTGPALAVVTTGVLVSALESDTALSYLAPLWPGWVSEEGEQLEVTVLVCDMSGYTARSEESSPAEMMRMMREFFAIVDDVVRSWGGVPARRPGDAAVVFFRPEERREHHARRALDAAVELRSRLQARWADEGIGFGITLTTGQVSLGWVGEEPPEPQILGDPVNVAFRLQTECRERARPILADWQTASADEAVMARMRPLAQVQVRNRTQPVQIFAPVDD